MPQFPSERCNVSSSETIRVMGIDPGITTTGYGIVERKAGTLRAIGFGAIRTPAGQPQAERLAGLQQGLTEAMATYSPDAVALERLFFNANVRTAMAVGQASGVALATVATAGLEAFSYTPPEVKQSVVGVGNATKHQVQVMVMRVLGLAEPPSPPDAADACALAICHLTRIGLSRAIAAAAR